MPTETTNAAVPGVQTWSSNAVRVDGLQSKSSGTRFYARQLTTTTRTWSRTPNFVKLKKAGTLPVNPYSFNRRIITYATGYLTQVSDDGAWKTTDSSSGVHQDALESPIPLTNSEMASLDSQAVTDIRNQIKDQKTNLAQLMAEREQTAKLVVSTAVKLARAMNQLKRGNISGASQTLTGLRSSRTTKRGFQREVEHRKSSAVSQAWLELNYGWQPLLNDVYGTAETIAQKKSGEIRATAKTSKTKSSEKSEVFVNSPSNGVHKLRAYRTKAKIKYTLHYGTPHPSTHLAAQLGLTNPLYIAWELTGFSFVVDWFLPIGNWLNSLDAVSGLSFQSGSKVTIVEMSARTVITDSTPVPKQGYITSRSGTRQGTITDLIITRDKLTDFPAAQLPRFKNPLSVTHALNALALLQQIFTSEHSRDVPTPRPPRRRRP